MAGRARAAETPGAQARGLWRATLRLPTWIRQNGWGRGDVQRSQMQALGTRTEKALRACSLSTSQKGPAPKVLRLQAASVAAAVGVAASARPPAAAQAARAGSRARRLLQFIPIARPAGTQSALEWHCACVWARKWAPQGHACQHLPKAAQAQTHGSPWEAARRPWRGGSRGSAEAWEGRAGRDQAARGPRKGLETVAGEAGEGAHAPVAGVGVGLGQVSAGHQVGHAGKR